MNSIRYQPQKRGVMYGYFLQQNGQECCTKDRPRRCARNAIQNGLLLCLFGILFLWIASQIQNNTVKHLEGTASLYETPRVCAMEYPELLLSAAKSNVTTNFSTGFGTLDPIVTETFETAEIARRQKNVTIAHWGDCGSCSNPHDIRIYDRTKNSLFRASYTCSKLALFGGVKTARQCMKDAVGFTDDCNECWVENIMCDLKNCIFTCLWHTLFSQVNSGNGQPQALNPCTLCDEKRCGPAFVTCAGANRRRSGILSEFERDTKLEVCSTNDVGWWNDTILQDYWWAQHVQEQEYSMNHLRSLKGTRLSTDRMQLPRIFYSDWNQRSTCRSKSTP